MNSTIQATHAQHLGEIPVFLQKFPGVLEMTGKKVGGSQRHDHDFGIRHLYLLVFVMVEGGQQFVTQDKHGGNRILHWGVIFWDGVVLFHGVLLLEHRVLLGDVTTDMSIPSSHLKGKKRISRKLGYSITR